MQDLKAANPLTSIRSALDPLRAAGEDIGRELKGAATPMSDPRPPTGVVAEPGEPLKLGPRTSRRSFSGTRRRRPSPAARGSRAVASARRRARRPPVPPAPAATIPAAPPAPAPLPPAPAASSPDEGSAR